MQLLDEIFERAGPLGLGRSRDEVRVRHNEVMYRLLRDPAYLE